MNTKARTAPVCIIHSALPAFVFAVALLTSAYAQTSGPDQQRRAWDSGVYLPIHTPAGQQHSHATEGPLGDDLPAVPIQPWRTARAFEAALDFWAAAPKSTRMRSIKAVSEHEDQAAANSLQRVLDPLYSLLSISTRKAGSKYSVVRRTLPWSRVGRVFSW